MNKARWLVFTITVAMSCEFADSPLMIEDVTSCEWPTSYEADRMISDWEGTVILVTGVFPENEMYLLDFPGQLVSLPLNACNLPEEAKADGLSVVVSGRIMTFSGIELADLVALPFELTAIQYDLSTRFEMVNRLNN